MLDFRWVYDNLEHVKTKMAQRNATIDWERFVVLFDERRRALKEFEESRFKQRQLSEGFKTASKDPGALAALRDELKTLSEAVKDLEKRVAEAEDALGTFLLYVPNVPHETVPVGASEHDNVVLRTWGQPRVLPFSAKPHWEVGEGVGILDLEAASKVSGARFVLYKGMGAKLELALAMFMLDIGGQRGYTPVLPPYLVTQECMTGTGQLPKFEEEAYRVDDLYLIPTAEVPVTNMHREELLDEAQLPIKYVAYSSCFRREAGAAGRDTRGITRVHQFQKVELVKFCRPEDSYAEHEALVRDAEEILQQLELPYRVMALCTADIGFSAARCYDIEVWLPGANAYREISSCSNFEDFQARRADIRYRPASEGNKQAKPRFVHTLNGSGLAIGRTLVAILENYQQEDGSVMVPKALRPYLGGVEVLRK